MPEVFVGLGSNIEPWAHLRGALASLGTAFGPLTRSHVYRSPPFGFDGPDFLNMVVGLTTSAGPAAVDAVLSDLEHVGGRGTDRRGSRTLDLDLLLYGQRIDPGLRLPRADVLEYPFVLAPLAALAPAAVHPVTGQRYADAWRTMAPRCGMLRELGPIDASR